MKTDANVRAFLAVSPDPAWVESARELIARLRSGLPVAAWTRPASWHLTLKFLGEIPVDAMHAFAARIGPHAAERAAGELTSSGAVVFPPRGAPRVLGVGFGASAALEEIRRLAMEAESVARGIGAERGNRPFRPHVTFARLRRPWARGAVASYEREVAGWAFPPWAVRACVLYSSRLAAEGAVHTPIAEWAFAVQREASA